MGVVTHLTQGIGIYMRSVDESKSVKLQLIANKDVVRGISGVISRGGCTYHLVDIPNNW